MDEALPGIKRLEYAADGRALLPEHQKGDEQYVVDILEAFIQHAWRKSTVVSLLTIIPN